jgi:hypothetical protein
MDRAPAVPAPAVPAPADDASRVRNVLDQDTANLIARVNAVPVTVEDMYLAVAEIHKLPLKTCNREARTRSLARIFNGQTYKVIAVNSRLEAMGEVVRSGKIRRWVLPNVVAEVVFFAAAKAPILLTEKKWFFDQEAFVAFVLDNAAVDGHA